jgi:general secretion pathway protein E
MRLGEMLLERNLLSAEDLERALELQKERGEKIGKILADGGYCAARDVMATLSEQLRLPLITIDGPPAVSPETEKLSPRFLRQFRCLPIALQDSSVTMAMADPLDFETLAAVRAFTGLRVDPVLAYEQEILDAVDRFYGESADRGAMAEFGDGQAAEDLEHLRDMASEAPVIRLVNAMIAMAV